MEPSVREGTTTLCGKSKEYWDSLIDRVSNAGSPEKAVKSDISQYVRDYLFLCMPFRLIRFSWITFYYAKKIMVHVGLLEETLTGWTLAGNKTESDVARFWKMYKSYSIEALATARNNSIQRLKKEYESTYTYWCEFCLFALCIY
jgi:hypothetical protein